MSLARLGALLAATAGLALLGACSAVAPPRYAASVDNVMQLKRLPAGQWRMGTIAPPADYQRRCRLAAPVDGPDGQSIPHYIERAFNDEFKLAGIYADGATPLSGRLTKLAFDTFAGIGRGQWDIELTLRGASGRELTVSQHHEFGVSLDGVTACDQTARALQPAVQDLIQQAVAQPAFAQLIR